MWDVFISHATEDKRDVARPLAGALVARGLRVWFDETELRPGDSLSRSIDLGLSRSRFGVVILSPNFFRKAWPVEELAGLRARQMTGERVLIPIWHEVGSADVRQFSLPLSDLIAIPTSLG